MGKRRKPGNVNPKKQIKRKGTAYFRREKEMNRLLRTFVQLVYNPNYNLQSIASYRKMNEIRMKLKKLFDEQRNVVWYKNAKRCSIYSEQLSRFKFVYTKWKSETYLTYLNINFDVQVHLNPTLSEKLSIL